MPVYTDRLFRPLFRSIVNLDKAQKAMGSHQFWRRLLEVHSLSGDWENVLNKQLEEAEADTVDKVVPLILLWKALTPVRCVPGPATA